MVSANGKSNIFAEVVQNINEEKILVIADGAAFGPEMNRMAKIIQERENIALYLPESFEWIILKSGVSGDREVREILKAPQNYIDSGKYFSWERYFTALLIEKTKDSYLKYTKKRLNPVYLQEGLKNRICGQMEGIELL